MPAIENQRHLARLWLQGLQGTESIGRMTASGCTLVGCDLTLAVRVGPSDYAGTAVLARPRDDGYLTGLQQDYLAKLAAEAEAAAIPLVEIPSDAFSGAVEAASTSLGIFLPGRFIDALVGILVDECVSLLEGITARARSLATCGEGYYTQTRMESAWAKYREVADLANRVCALDARETPAVAAFPPQEIDAIVAGYEDFAARVAAAIASPERAATEAAREALDEWARGEAASGPGMRSRSFARIRIRPHNPEIVESSNGGYCFTRADLAHHGRAILKAIREGGLPSGARIALSGASVLAVTPAGDVVIGVVTFPGADFERVIVQSGAPIPVGHAFRFLGAEPAAAAS